MAQVPPAAVMQVFIFRDGEFLGSEIFSERQILVGRDPSTADLVLESPSVSRRHALIAHDCSLVRVRDEGSSNGLFVNRKKVQTASVGRLDEIAIGEYTLKVKLVARSRKEADPTLLAPDVSAGGSGDWDEGPKGGARETEHIPSPSQEPTDGGVSGARAGRIETVGHSKPQDAEDLEEEDSWGGPGTAASADGVYADDPSYAAALREEHTGDAPRWADPYRRNDRDAPPQPSDRFASEPEPLTPARGRSRDDGSFSAERYGRSGSVSASRSRPRDHYEPVATAARGNTRLVQSRDGDYTDEVRERREARASRGRHRNEMGDEASSPRGWDSEEVQPQPYSAVRSSSTSRGRGPDRAAPGALAYAYDDDEDEDDEDESYVPPFSLVDRVKAEGKHLYGGEPPADCCVEVLRLRGETLADASFVWPGERFWVGPDVGFARRRAAPDLPRRHRLLRSNRSGECTVSLPVGAAGTVARRGSSVPLGQPSGRHGAEYAVRPGEVVDVDWGSESFHLRYVTPPEPLRDARGVFERVTPDARLARSLCGSLGGHLILVVLVSLLAVTDATMATQGANDDFAEVPVDVELDMQEPPPEPEPEPEPVPEPVPEPEPTPRRQKRERRKPPPPGRAKMPKFGGTSPPKPGVLGLLSKRGSSAAPGPAAAVAAVSNLSAAKVPGARTGFRVSGLIGKLPTSSLAVGGGGGGPITKGGAALLRGGGGGAGRLAGTGGSRGVRGLVSKQPKSMRKAGQGTLSREDIQLVINKNIGQIQRCYERELVKQPGISGKVQVEWTIAISGSVRQSRQTFSNLNSVNVVNCILGSIKGWQFPRPKGGEVVVNYPFVFKSIGF